MSIAWDVKQHGNSISTNNFRCRQAFIVSNNDVIVVEVKSGYRMQLLTHPTKIVSLYYAFPGKVSFGACK